VHADIRQYPTTSVAVEPAVRNAGQPTLETQTKRLSMSIGQLEPRKAFYIAPLPRYDAILGAPFVQEFDVRIPPNPVAMIKGIEVRLIQEIPRTPETQKIQMISRPKLKKLVRHIRPTRCISLTYVSPTPSTQEPREHPRETRESPKSRETQKRETRRDQHHEPRTIPKGLYRNIPRMIAPRKPTATDDTL
jgi:hypothetical protein